MKENIYICMTCGKVGTLDEFFYHQTAKAYDHGEGDWEPDDGYHTCCTAEDTVLEAVECRECGEFHAIGYHHTCPIADTDASPSVEATIKLCLDQLAEIVTQIESINESLRGVQ